MTSSKRKLGKVALWWGLLFCCWLAFQALTNSAFENTPFYKTISLLIMPGALVPVLLGPQGHDIPTFIVGMIVAVILSVLLYMAVAWVIMVVADRHQAGK